jgi:hypothetical protein
MKNIFNPSVTEEVISRINSLSPNSDAKWGRMSVSKMLAHCNVTYELVYESKHPKPQWITKLIMRLFVKNKVVGDAPYDKDSRTAPEFIIHDERNFEFEKKRLIEHLQKSQRLGEGFFHMKESHSFGRLTAKEWSTLFYKHLDHHLNQFGV